MSNRAFHVVILAIALTGCTQINRATLAASTLGIACDAAQTYRASTDGWHDHYEQNMVMGPAPSPPTVLGYFSAALVVNAVVWAVMPDSLKSAVPLAVIGMQTNAIAGNIDQTHSICGVPYHRS